MLRSDHILGGLSILAGAVLMAASFSIAVSPFVSTLSAQFFPRVLAGCFLLLGAALVLRPRSAGFASALAPLLSPRFVGFAVVTGLYFIAFPDLDFRLSTALFLAFAMLLMGSRNVIELLAVPICGAVGIWLVFRFGFGVLLPTWL